MNSEHESNPNKLQCPQAAHAASKSTFTACSAGEPHRRRAPGCVRLRWGGPCWPGHEVSGCVMLRSMRPREREWGGRGGWPPPLPLLLPSSSPSPAAAAMRAASVPEARRSRNLRRVKQRANGRQRAQQVATAWIRTKAGRGPSHAASGDATLPRPPLPACLSASASTSLVRSGWLRSTCTAWHNKQGRVRAQRSTAWRGEDGPAQSLHRALVTQFTRLAACTISLLLCGTRPPTAGTARSG